MKGSVHELGSGTADHQRDGPAPSAQFGPRRHAQIRFRRAGQRLYRRQVPPNTVSDGAGKTADCTITVTLETFEKMVKGELDGTSAFMQGKLRVAGDMGLAMKLGPILQKARG